MAHEIRVRWRRIFKIAVIGVLIFIVLFGVTTWVLFRMRNDLVLTRVQAWLDQTQSGQLVIQQMDLRPFRNFPNVTIALDSVSYFERRDTLREPGETPILRVEKIYVSLAWLPLFRGEVEISEISIRNGQVNLVETSPGTYNINHALLPPRKLPPASAPQQPSAPATPRPAQRPAPSTKSAEPEPSAPMARVDLENVSISQVRLTIQRLGLEEPNTLLITDLEASLAQGGQVADVQLTSTFALEHVVLQRTQLPSGQLRFHLNGRWEKSTGRLTINRTSVSLDILKATASGVYEHRNHQKLDLQVDASSSDLPILERVLRQGIIDENRDLLRGGDFYVKGKIFGELEHQTPRFDISFGAKRLSIRLPGNYGSFREVGFEGSLQSGSANNYSDAVINLSIIQGQLPGGSVDGTARLTNFMNPWLRCKLTTQFAVDGFDKVFRLDRVQELRGKVSTKIDFDGPLRIPWPGKADAKATYDAQFSVDSLSFRLDSLEDNFRDLTLRGTLTSGPEPDKSLAQLDIAEFRGHIPGGSVDGEFRLTNLLKPVLHYNFAASADLRYYESLLGLNLRHLQGKARAALQFDGPLELIGTHAMDSSRSSVIGLDSVSFEWREHKVTQLQATLSNQNNLAKIDLGFRYGASDVQLNASAENLMFRLFRNERLVQASGRITCSQVKTRDLIIDSFRTPLVDDVIRNLSMEFQVDNGLPVHDTVMTEKELHFTIRKLKAQFDQLADIQNLEAKGVFRSGEQGIRLVLDQFNLYLPEGSLALSGDMAIPARRKLNAHAHLKLMNFPWDYAQDIIAEIKDGAEPSHKHLPSAELHRLSGDLDLTGMIRTFPFDVEKLEIRNTRLKYTQPNKQEFGVDRVDATIAPLFFEHPAGSGALTGLRIAKGTVFINGMRVPGFINLDLNMIVFGRSDSLKLTFFNVTEKSRTDNGTFFLDFSKPTHFTRFHYGVKDAPVENLVGKFAKKDFLHGTISYSVDLESSGENLADLRRNVAGTAKLDGDSLEFRGIDIDNALTKYERSQKFNLVDLGAVVLVGPLGIVATKGSDFVTLATIDVNNKKSTSIGQLVANWNLENQVLTTTDVAFSTRKNRIAFQGAIDFSRDSIAGLRIAVVDEKGCSLMDQQVYGRFDAIKTGKLNIARTIFGPVINFVDAIAGKDCKPFYTGKVKDPSN